MHGCASKNCCSLDAGLRGAYWGSGYATIELNWPTGCDYLHDCVRSTHRSSEVMRYVIDRGAQYCLTCNRSIDLHKQQCDIWDAAASVIG